jgi:two-component system sensor histidine kinase RegB
MPESSIQEKANQSNLMLLVTLRWVAVAGQIAAIAVVHYWIKITLPIATMGGVVMVLATLNLLTLYRAKSDPKVTNTELFLQLLLDVAALTAQLHLSGGASNPFISLYLLQVILGAVLLRSWSCWSMVGITSLCFIGLTISYQEIGLTYYVPAIGAPAYTNLHVQGMFICFLLAAVLLVIFLMRITQNLRDRDRRLAEFNRQSSEEDHIVRMGLLASGAAHELGTPLATLSVILNDWERLPGLRQDPDMALEFDEMHLALSRCKEIISRVLMSAGQARGEGSERTTLVAFFDQLVLEWRGMSSMTKIDYDIRVDPDLAIASDLLFRQILGNVFDNALEVSPDWVGIEVSRDEDQLEIAIRDQGPGFQPEILARIGHPYQSTKRRPGGGLGLFLVATVLRKLGGSVSASNPAGGGAKVAIRLPIASLAIEAIDDRR